MTVPAPSSVRLLIVAVLALTALRLVAAALTPLAFDEAYYWMWSQHLAGGYLDHPPMVALVIRAGTVLAGDTEFGVRLVSILLALPMSWAVYRSALILFGSARVAAASVILLNVTLIASAGTMIVTPDAPLLVAAAFVLLSLAKVWDTGRGVWWLAVGVAVGAALLSKYTAFFFGLQILLWLILVPELRRWLKSPWPYLGGAVAFALFAPVIIWNAEHHWVSFAKQFGRARVDGFTLRYIGELIPAQIGFATPLVFILGVMGACALLKRDTGPRPARLLINLSIWPILIYFLWHSLHSRIEANWLAPIYPAFAIAAALAAHDMAWRPRAQRLVAFCRRFAVPTGVAMFVLLIVQANTGWLSGYGRDPTVRSIGVGMPQFARDVEAARLRTDTQCVVALDYGTTAWLAFYLPRSTCVAQLVEPIRWVNMPPRRADDLAKQALLLDYPAAPVSAQFGARCPNVTQAGHVERRRGPLVVESYLLVAPQCPLGNLLDPAS